MNEKQTINAPNEVEANTHNRRYVLFNESMAIAFNLLLAAFSISRIARFACHLTQCGHPCRELSTLLARLAHMISTPKTPTARMSALGRGCVKTSIESQFVPRLRNFRKSQFAKALISLRLEFRLLRQNHNSNSSLAFSHSLDP
jgi:hypothetical protein